MADSTNFVMTVNRKRRASGSTDPFNSSSPLEFLERTSMWTKNKLDKLKIVTNITAIYTPMQLISRAYMCKEWDCEMDQKIKTYKEHILVRSPLHMLDVDCFEKVDIALACSLRSWIKEFTNYDPWNEATVKDKGNDYRLWHMFHSNAEQFAEQLIYMNKNMRKKGRPPTEFMYQILFQHFVGMLGLSFISAPQLDGCEIKIGNAEVTSLPDVVFPCPAKNEETVEVIAICKVKECFKEETDTSPGQTRNEKKQKVVHHLDDSLLGQLGGDLVAHFPLSKNQRGLLGIVVQTTFVTFCHFDCTSEQFEEIKTGNPHPSVKPEISFSKPYNILKASDRRELIEAFLKLGCIQNMPLK